MTRKELDSKCIKYTFFFRAMHKQSVLWEEKYFIEEIRKKREGHKSYYDYAMIKKIEGKNVSPT